MHEFTPPSTLPRILLVEDHDMTRRLQMRFLSRMYAVDFASSAEEAWQMAFQRLYVAFVIDLNLGGRMSGIELMQRLKATLQYRQTAMIATTGYARPEDREMLLRAGFDVYLPKPFRFQDFSEAVRHAVSVSMNGDGHSHALPPTAQPTAPQPVPPAQPQPHAPPPPASTPPERRSQSWRSLGDL